MSLKTINLKLTKTSIFSQKYLGKISVPMEWCNMLPQQISSVTFSNHLLILWTIFTQLSIFQLDTSYLSVQRVCIQTTCQHKLCKVLFYDLLDTFRLHLFQWGDLWCVRSSISSGGGVWIIKMIKHLTLLFLSKILNFKMNYKQNDGGIKRYKYWLIIHR